MPQQNTNRAMERHVSVLQGGATSRTLSANTLRKVTHGGCGKSSPIRNAGGWLGDRQLLHKHGCYGRIDAQCADKKMCEAGVSRECHSGRQRNGTERQCPCAPPRAPARVIRVTSTTQCILLKDTALLHGGKLQIALYRWVNHFFGPKTSANCASLSP